MIGYCPECGEAVVEVREAHRVGVGGAGTRPKGPMTWPSGQCVLFPCGHPLPTRVVHLLSPER